MRRDGTSRRIAGLAALLLAALAPAEADAGLWLRPDPGSPNGADVRAFASSGGVFWAGTVSGVFRGTSIAPAEAWAHDGLGGRPVSSIAVFGGEVWAATGEELWRRSAAGSWTIETLPSAVAFPATVAVDASGTLWAGGLGAWRKTAGGWTAAPSPGAGIVVSMLPDPQGLVVGLSSGLAARWNGSGWNALAGGVGPSEGFYALASFGGTLWAGTNITLYAWNGASWVADTAFGGHDVRALTTWGGSLRAATADAGVLVRTGSTWIADSSGILPRGAQAFLQAGTDLLVGTAGGPVYRRSGSGWVVAGGAGAGRGRHRRRARGPGRRPVAGVRRLARRGQPVRPRRDRPAVRRGPRPSAPPERLRRRDRRRAGRGKRPRGAGGDGLRPVSLEREQLLERRGRPARGRRPSNSRFIVLRDLRRDREERPLEVLRGFVERRAGAGIRADGDGERRPLVRRGPLGRNGRGALRAPVGRTLRRRVGGHSLCSPGRLARGRRVDGLRGARDGGRLPPGGGRRVPPGRGGLERRARPLSRPLRRAALGRRGAGRARGPPGGGLGRGRLGAPGRDGRDARERHGDRRAFRQEDASRRDEGPRHLVGRDPVLRADAPRRPGRRRVRRRPLPVGARPGLALGSRHDPSAGFHAGPGLRGARRDARSGYGERNDPRGARDPGRRRPVVPSLARDAGPGRDPGRARRGEPQSGRGRPAPRRRRVPRGADLHPRRVGRDVRPLLRRPVGPRGRRGGSGGLRPSLGARRSPLEPRGRPPAGPWRRSDRAVGAGLLRERPARGKPPRTEPRSRGVDPVERRPGPRRPPRGVVRLREDPADGRRRRVRGLRCRERRADLGRQLPPCPAPGRSRSGADGRRPRRPRRLRRRGLALHDRGDARQRRLDRDARRPRLQAGAGVRGGRRSPRRVGRPRRPAAGDDPRRPGVPQVARHADPRGDDRPAGGDAHGHVPLPVGDRRPRDRRPGENDDAEHGPGGGGSVRALLPGRREGRGSEDLGARPRLSQDESVRANLAVVNVGGGSELPITLEARLYDADTGAAAGSPLTVRLFPGDWVQWSRVHTLAGAPASVKRFTAVVRRTSGDDTFLAYGVLNDAVTSDGSYQTMIPADPY